jgi:ATP synthase in type III secretion protein N
MATLEKLDPLLEALPALDPLRRVGRVAEAYGTLIRVTGIAARIGELCELRDPATGHLLSAEVVGPRGDLRLH